MADTAFTLPAYPHEENLGTNGKVISADTTITTVESGNEPATVGELYMVNGSRYICEAANSGNTCDNNTSNRVTGLKINEGVTVTLGLNKDTDDAYDNNESTGQDEANIQLEGDLVLNGTLKTAALTTAGGTADSRHGAAATARDKGALNIYQRYDGALIIGANGKIDTSGDDATVANERGGDGGAVNIDLNYAFSKVDGTIDASGGNGLGTGDGGDAAIHSENANEIYIYSYGTIVHTGSHTINASGGNGASGGHASEIELESYYGSVYNEGTLLAVGGNGTTGSGGNGGYIYVYSDYASIYNSGDMKSSGGNGAKGGDASAIYLYPGYDSYIGEILNSGDLYANGGNGSSGNGGSGAEIYFYLYGAGDARTSGNIYANGGNGVGADGGDAGDLYIYQEGYGEDGTGVDEEVAPGGIEVSGNIEVNGGNGDANGGAGGYVEAEIDDYSSENNPAVGLIRFLGYSSFDVSGGDGNTTGGNAGNVEAYTEDAWTGSKTPAGAIINEVQIIAKGGYAENGEGGYGGYVEFDAEGEYYDGTTKLINTAAIDLSGGLGLGGGDSGYLYWYAHDGVENSGEITAVGGDAEGDTGSAGEGASDGIEIYSSRDILNSAAITATGGNGTGANTEGGSSYYDGLEMYAGGIVTNSGNLYFNGGASSGTAINSDGGYVDIWSEIAHSVNTATVIDVSEGTGGSGTEGETGEIYLDGINVTPNDGVLD
ncbi:MAG: hypothetical protein P794_05950 [Epsilonproteobacteria bacterium (ex Lamellibrachia satsuma)]|nr:MAG: hypothetical protein P794_05950 [Epsilonproteobacteria bacterium (ex Lamellibrachia satsuma)]